MTMILKRRMQMENNVKHFTLGPSDENTYGWPWNEVVMRAIRKSSRVKSGEKSTKSLNGMQSQCSMTRLGTLCLM